jgi:endoglucanase
MLFWPPTQTATEPAGEMQPLHGYGRIPVLLLVVTLAACGGDGGSSGRNPPPPPPPVTTTTAVLLNQTGFHPGSGKFAIVVTDATNPIAWSLLDGAGTQVASGMTTRFGVNAGSGETVHQVDFSAYGTEGDDLVIEVDGVDSEPFSIRNDVYARLKFDVLNFFYQQRSADPIVLPYAGGAEWTRPAGHPADLATCYGPVDFRGNDWGGCPYTLDATGGWYDAGDHGKYVVNSGISVWTLLDYFERSLSTPAAAATVADGAAAIPEDANGQPDLLDEARYNLDFMLAMQVPDGTTLTLPLGNQFGNLDALVFTSVDASGMAHHKIHDEHWTGIPQRPDLDPETRFLSYPSTAATLNLAAVAAQCARLWAGIDQAFADRCLAAAERAYAAAVRVPDALAYDVTDGGGGAYGDTSLGDEFYWAAAELFITTGDNTYADAMRASPYFLGAPADIAWPSTQGLGNISLLESANGLTAGERATLEGNLIALADDYLALEQGEGYRIPFAGPYVWGSNSDFANHGIVLALAFDLTGEERYRQGVVDAMDYLLGRNPVDKSYVSGYGENPLTNPHHRFWAHSADPSFPGPPPGALAGGSNFSSPADPVAQSIYAGCTPQTCYRDDIGAYSLNEVAINWNAPLFWIAAFLDERPDL